MGRRLELGDGDQAGDIKDQSNNMHQSLGR